MPIETRNCRSRKFCRRSSSPQPGSKSFVSGDVHSAKGIFETTWLFRDCPLTSWMWTPASRGPTYCSSSSMRTSVWMDGSNTAPNSLRLPRSREWQRISGHCSRSIVANPEERISSVYQCWRSGSAETSRGGLKSYPATFPADRQQFL